jgi:flagellar hook-associated protein 3 FlgL
MRVTQNSNASQVLSNLQSILQRQEQLQQHSEKRVLVPGDDPVAAQQILHLNTLAAANDQYARNIGTGNATLAVTESAMSSLGGVLSRAKELALQMSSGTNNADAKTAAANEFQQMRSEVIALGNTQFNGKFIFGGFKNDTAPFDLVSGAFSGTVDDQKVEVAQGSLVPITYSGQTLISGGSPAGSTGTDIIGVFDKLLAAVAPAGTPALVQAQLGNLDNAMGQVLSGRSEIGARTNRLTSATSINDDMKLSLQKVTSGLQDADFTQVISDLTKQQTAYQTAVAASAKISQISLLDYMR